MTDSFPVFALSEEHQAIRETVRAIAEAKIAPRAAELDAEPRYPEEVAAALTAADFHVSHVPEGVRRSRSRPARWLDAGTARGVGGAKQKYLRRRAANEGGFSYRLSEPDAGSDAAAMRTRAVRDGDTWVLDGVKRWITNADVSEFFTVMAVTDVEKRSRGISAFVVERSDEGLSFGAPEKKRGIKGSPTREVYLDKGADPPRCHEGGTLRNQGCQG